MQKLKKTYLEEKEYIKTGMEEYERFKGDKGFENLNDYKKLIRSKLTE